MVNSYYGPSAGTLTVPSNITSTAGTIHSGFAITCLGNISTALGNVSGANVVGTTGIIGGSYVLSAGITSGHLTSSQVLIPATTTSTLTASQVIGTIVTSTGVAAYSCPLPSAASVFAALPTGMLSNNQTFTFQIMNQGGILSSLAITSAADGTFDVNWPISVDNTMSVRTVTCRIRDASGSTNPWIIAY